VRAVVVLEPGTSATLEELQEYAAASLARYKVPTSVHFLATLPHSLTGKVSRARLRELGLTRAGEEPAEGSEALSRD
jgi:long-chain acyl-CoA synthetase